MLVYQLKQAYRDGTKYLLFSPEELLEKLAALVPRPRVHLIRYHGCLAPNAKIRAEVVSQARGPEGEEAGAKPQEGRGPRRRMGWARLLKRVFKVDVESCQGCGGKLRVIAAVMDPGAIGKILGHLGLPTEVPKVHPARAPP
jgi:hypothetical protein